MSSISTESHFSCNFISWLNILHLTCNNIINDILFINIETIVKLELIRVFVHETVLVLIRKSLKDLNESTNPELLFKNQDVEESGILIELELFGAKIKFYNTCQSSSIDEDYFARLLDSIVNGSSFAHDQTKFISVEKSRYSKVTLDFDVQDDCFLDL